MHTFGKYTQLRFLNRFDIAYRGNGLRQLFRERVLFGDAVHEEWS